MSDNKEKINNSVAYKPSFGIYHANPKGTGCAIKLELIPATPLGDGCIMLCLARQKTVGSRDNGVVTYPTFDWENKITIKLGFNDVCKMLQVFKGECESLENGKGIIHRSGHYLTKISLRHTIEPAGYSLEVYKNGQTEDDKDKCAHITLSTYEALGVAISFENSISYICFGIPKEENKKVDQGAA